MKFKIIQTAAYPLTLPAASIYAELQADRFVKACHADEDFIRECRDADALIVTGMTRLSKEVISHLDRCRVISVIGTGYQVDVAAATQKGICVVNVPDYCHEEVSDHAMALILACARKINQLNDAVRTGLWTSMARSEIRNRVWPGMVSLRGKTLGLIGFGNIARRMVEKAKGFGMEVIAYSPNATPGDINDMGVFMCELEEVVAASDFVSLHCPLTESSHHLFDSVLLSRMKSSAFLINTARGPLVDEVSLYKALVDGQLAGAGLDVLEREDPPDAENPLLGLPQVIITAHSAHYSDTAMVELKQRPDQAVCQILKGQWPEGVVNPEVRSIFESRWGMLGEVVFF